MEEIVLSNEREDWRRKFFVRAVFAAKASPLKTPSQDGLLS
jgi:hypothetical protein